MLVRMLLEELCFDKGELAELVEHCQKETMWDAILSIGQLYLLQDVGYLAQDIPDQDIIAADYFS